MRIPYVLRLCGIIGCVLHIGIACGDPGNSLGGTLGNEVDLYFDQIRAYINGEFLVIVYQRHNTFAQRIAGIGPVVENQVIRFSLNSTAQTIVPNTLLPLLPSQDTPIANVEHYCLSSSNGITLQQDPPLAEMVGGDIFFYEASFVPGHRIRGYFTVSLEDGTDIQATFDTILKYP